MEVLEPEEAEQEVFDSSPITVEESLTASQNLDAMGALAMSRRRGEFERWEDMRPWQRIGPELLFGVANQDTQDREKFLNETVDHLFGLRWVRISRVPRKPLEYASNTALDRLFFRKHLDHEIAAMSCGARINTYVNLHAEATVFLTGVLCIATQKFLRARYGRGES